MDNFNLIMISAGFEQGGNVLQRHLDGHPELIHSFAETQLGTSLSSNLLTPSVHFRYAWPVLPLDGDFEKFYDMLYDEELKTFLRTPDRSKFKNCGAIIDETKRIKEFKNCMLWQEDHSRAKRVIESYFYSTFKAWENYTNKEEADANAKYYVGYCPAIVMDADKFFRDFPNGHMIHIVRNPFSGYADTLKRPFPWSLEKYCQIWNVLQMFALNYVEKYPGRFHLHFYESLVGEKKSFMEMLCDGLDLPFSENLLYPSFNLQKLETVYPWGTIKQTTIEENNAAELSLSKEQRDKILIECNQMIETIYG